jgi:ubiquinone/menaquinone biosynthesis C-methylase UbiE
MIFRKKLTDPYLEQQEQANAYFQARSLHWKDLYSIVGVQAEIIRDRHSAVLNWIDSLDLTPGSQVAEIGCGAGFMAIALAQRDFHVHAIDSAEAMIELARVHAAEAGLTGTLSCNVGDVYSLAFEDSSFDLVIAIGVVPWLELAALAIREMVRVTRPGGYVILTTANRVGLASLLDPMVGPLLRPLKLAVKHVLVRSGLRPRSPNMVFHGNRSIDRTLKRMGLVKMKGMTRGFGFSFFRHSVLPEPLPTKLNHKMQHLADRGVFGFRSTGMAYFVLARKPAQGKDSGAWK